MSSIQRFLKQRNPATSIVQAPDNDCYYIFVAGPGNYVGNYPPGYMQLATVNPALIPQGTLLRDMGKTIKAPIGTNPFATAGFFQEVQFIAPQPASVSNTFGVGKGSQGAGVLPSAGNAGDAGYGTYYLATVIDGTLATSDGTTTAVLPIVSTVPAAPTITRIEPGDGQLAVHFTPGSDGGSPITDHQYSVNGGPLISVGVSPFTIIGLTNDVSHRITMKSSNVKGFGLISTMVFAIPQREIPNITSINSSGSPNVLTVTTTSFNSFAPDVCTIHTTTSLGARIHTSTHDIDINGDNIVIRFNSFANIGDSFTDSYIQFVPGLGGGSWLSWGSARFYFTMGGASGIGSSP